MVKRTELEQEVVNALIESKAIDFEAIGAVVAKYGEQAARQGSDFGVLVNWRHIDICIPPYYRELENPALAVRATQVAE